MTFSHRASLHSTEARRSTSCRHVLHLPLLEKTVWRVLPMRRTVSQERRYRYRTNKQDLGWTEERADAEKTRHNIGEGQRLLSAVAGAGLLAVAPKRSWLGAFLA